MPYGPLELSAGCVLRGLEGFIGERRAGYDTSTLRECHLSEVHCVSRGTECNAHQRPVQSNGVAGKVRRVNGTESVNDFRFKEEAPWPLELRLPASLKRS